MNPALDDVVRYSDALAFAAYGALFVYLLWAGRLRRADVLAGRSLIAALAATTAWAGWGLLAHEWPTRGLAPWSAPLDLLRYALWFVFLLALLRPAQAHAAVPRGSRILRMTAAATVCLSAAALALGALGVLGDAIKLRNALALALPVCGLLIVEQLFRNLAEASRWNAKPLCIGLLCVFVFDIYLYTEALLFGRFDSDAYSVRSGVHALAVPFLFIASRRGTNWMLRLQVSRMAAFYSATLVLAGLYLLFMAALGYYIRLFGGTWGGALQLGLLVAGLAFFGVLVFSGSMRSWLRVFVGKHFYSYRYDYREEWLRFTTMLSARRSPQETGEMIVRGLAKMVESPAGSLWTRSGSAAVFSQTVAWAAPGIPDTEAADGSLCTFLRADGWVVDLREFRASPRRYGELALPTWLLGAPQVRLVVPLLAGDDLQGFVLLAEPLTSLKLNWEVLDLLKTAGGQAAGYLAQMQATEALLEARKFEAFNRMSAFVVHDLKNIVAQLSLMLKNAERLHDNREFQQDMLLTVESSLEKMRRLMLQLREGATPPGGSRGVELTPIFGRLQQMARAQGRDLALEEAERLSTRGHDDRLERVLGHLVQNALDATQTTDRVCIKASRYGGQVQVEVSDNGAGMTEEFVRTKLFRPFNTTKHNGMGIGTYESFQYVRELGGSVAVDSSPGRGTLVTVRLPLFDGPFKDRFDVWPCRTMSITSTPLLIVEDDLALQKQIKWSLDRFDTVTASDRDSALLQLRRHQCAVVTMDLGLPPDADDVSEGFKLLQQMLELDPAVKVIVLTGQNDQNNALRAVALGAYDFLAKPFEPDVLNLTVERAFRLAELQAENRRLQALHQPDALSGLITRDAEMMRIARTVERVSSSDATVLLLGESGTGKEVLAQGLHAASKRAGRFVAINCAAIPENLLESELFGYEKGAFTGAAKTTPGKIETAHNGTLMLDEIGDLPHSLQAKLLRFLQQRTVERLGGRSEIPVDVRVVCATHQNLKTQIAENRFREDLFYRLAEIVVTIPPLRARIGDAVLLSHAFLRRYAQEQRRTDLTFSEDALKAIEQHPWPGNVRELQNAVKRASIMADTDRLSCDDLGLLPPTASDSGNERSDLDLRTAREAAERTAIVAALARSNGNIVKAAAILGVSRPTLYDLMKRLSIK